MKDFNNQEKQPTAAVSNEASKKKIVIFGITSMSTESSPHTNLLVTKMNNEAKKRKLNVIVQAHSISKLNEKAQEADVLLLSPELYSEAKDIKQRFPEKIVAVIDKKEYGLLDAANILLSVNS